MLTYYDLELDNVVKQIKTNKAKTVCIQLPDGLKPYATEIADYIEKNAKCQVLIWLGSCFGACDVPKVNADLLVQFGHSKFGKLY